jgi:hypothetical protein
MTTAPQGCEGVVVRLDCGAGGVQYRRLCLTCFRPSAAMSHAAAKEEIARAGVEPPLGDLEIIHRAQGLAAFQGRACK